MNDIVLVFGGDRINLKSDFVVALWSNQPTALQVIWIIARKVGWTENARRTSQDVGAICYSKENYEVEIILIKACLLMGEVSLVIGTAWYVALNPLPVTEKSDVNVTSIVFDWEAFGNRGRLEPLCSSTEGDVSDGPLYTWKRNKIFHFFFKDENF